MCEFWRSSLVYMSPAARVCDRSRVGTDDDDDVGYVTEAAFVSLLHHDAFSPSSLYFKKTKLDKTATHNISQRCAVTTRSSVLLSVVQRFIRFHLGVGVPVTSPAKRHNGSASDHDE